MNGQLLAGSQKDSEHASGKRLTGTKLTLALLLQWCPSGPVVTPRYFHGLHGEWADYFHFHDIPRSKQTELVFKKFKFLSRTIYILFYVIISCL